MSWRNSLLKSDIRKADYDITWKEIDIDDITIKNKPQELVSDTIEITASDATVEGGIDLDIRNWGVKSVYSFARKIKFTMTFEDIDTWNHVIDDIDIVIDDNIEDAQFQDEKERFNPSEIHIEVDMKGQQDPSKFETKATIYWQGSY